VDDAIELALDDARRSRAQGRANEAERAYSRAAELARWHKNSAALAHALRHMSDLTRERGASADAWEHASEAVLLYRSTDDRLGLANAIRLQALSASNSEQARCCWEEARDLYLSLGVISGVDECNTHLRNQDRPHVRNG
jgi:hypothetical protein